MDCASDSSTHASLPADEPGDSEPPERLTASIVEHGGDWSGFGRLEDAIWHAARALASRIGDRLPIGSEASVVLGSDEFVRSLNRTYRGKDSATNVLSFPFQPPPGAVPAAAPSYLGDVVLAAETIRCEAVERDVEPKHHLQHLVVHGLLHLLGYDHDTDASAAAMETLEGDILAAIGVADPYAVHAGFDNT